MQKKPRKRWYAHKDSQMFLIIYRVLLAVEYRLNAVLVAI